MRVLLSSWGSRGDVEPLAALALRLRQLGAEVRVCAPPDPEYAVVGEVNQQSLFRRVAAVVHHDGAGTTTTAALAGAPEVVVPQIVDQPHWARRVAELGIGANAGPTPTFEALSYGLATALKPETRERAAAVAGTIRTDGAIVAARMLLDGAG